VLWPLLSLACAIRQRGSNGSAALSIWRPFHLMFILLPDVAAFAYS